MAAMMMQHSMLSHRLCSPVSRPQLRPIRRHRADACQQVACSSQTGRHAPADSAQCNRSFNLMRQVLLSTAVTAPLLAVTAGAFAAEEGSVSKAAADVSASVNEIQQTVQDGANQVIDGTTPVPPLATGLIVFSPLILYGIFVTYRAKLNPRATLTDFAFIVAAVVIVLNLLSILVFKIRLF